MADELTEQGFPSDVSLIRGGGGLPMLSIERPSASTHIYLQGGQLTHWQPAGTEPVIFLSKESVFAEGKAIRGGVPICFPWFGPREGDVAHGFARNQAWALDAVSDEGADLRVTLSTRPDGNTRQRWHHEFLARLFYVIGTKLEMTLEVTNAGAEAFIYSEALHTYFQVGDVRGTRVLGLDGAWYRDFPDRTVLTQQRGDIQFTEETDRVYVNTAATCVLEDDSLHRRIIVEKSGSLTTTVWNPWIKKSAALADFGNDEWQRMVCIETVNAFENSITLGAGETHRMTARISVEPV
jgi:D-hexose-6-phosphate mutarotase